MRFRPTRPSDAVSSPAPAQPTQPPPSRPGAATGRGPVGGTGGVLSDRDISLVRTSLAVVEPQAAELAVYFYAILFTRYPQVREMFPPGMDEQRGRLLRALLRIVDLVDDPDKLVHFCSHLGRDHRKFGTRSEHYGPVGECLVAALERFAGPAWNAEVATAWTRAYTAAAQVMSQAAEDDARTRPAVWAARIVQHVQRDYGLAEITVKPDMPYHYTAGQYLSMETPWWPKAWRYYSPANAPRPDATMTFHVRAIPGGWVSNALVRRAAVGDVVRLGPPLGDMLLDPHSRHNILCVAGGTGLAPIRAMVEQAVQSGWERRMDLLIGARTAGDLYGLESMLRLAQRNHWLSVRAAVSHEDVPGARGSLPQVLAEYGPWHRHEAYLSGPPSMVTTAARVLTRYGVPPTRIHHDPLDSPALPTP